MNNMTGKQLMGLAIIAGILSGVAGYFALISPLSDASGWWQVAIAVAGLPIFFHELERIGENIKKAQWKPEIEIGVTHHPLSISNISLEQPLSTEIDLVRRSANFHFVLVLRNRGKLAARFVKIYLEFKSYEEKTYMPLLKIEDKVTGRRIFTTTNRKDFIFSGGSDWIIYPRDIQSFIVELDSHVGGTIRADRYFFQCTVWSEGLDDPVGQELIVQILEPPSSRLAIE